MRQFALFINDQARGPHTEAEIDAMIARGDVTAETLCAPAGSTEWEPLSNHFSFGSKLKVNRDRQAEPTAAGREDVDLEQRRKLLIYGLADSVTIDQFDRSEAQTLIDAHEAKVRVRIARHRWAGIGGLALGLAFGAYAGLRTGADRPLTRAAETIIGKDDKVSGKLVGLDREVTQFAKLKETVDAVAFNKPAGGTPALGVITARLKSDPSRSFRTKGQVSLAPLTEKAARWKATVDGGLKVILLKTPMPKAVAEKAAAQAEILDVVLSPMLESAKFEELREELARGFPELTGSPESDRLKTDIRQMKIAELTAIATRVDARASLAASNPSTAEWARHLKDFAARVRGLQDRIRINRDMQARRKLWSDFNAGAGSDLAAWVLASGGKEVTPGADGAFVVDEGPRLSEADAAARMVIATRVNGDPLHLTWGSPFLILGELRSEALPADHFLLSEKYKVVDKPVTGGRLFAAKLRVGGKELVVERRSPRWHFLTLAREKDPDVIHLLVDEATHGRHSAGDTVPASEIIKGEIYLKLSESAVPPLLTPVP